MLKEFTARGDIVDQLSHARYQRLDDAARITLDVLAVFGGPVTREPVEWVMRSLAPGLDPALALHQLVHVHMVSVDRRAKEFTLHQLDAEIACAALPEHGPVGRRQLERQVAAWYRSIRFPPPWRSLADVANHRREYEHLLRAGDYDQCAMVLDEIGEFLIWQGSNREVIGMHLAIQDHLNDDVAVLAHLVGYGQALDRCGPLEAAIQPLRQAVTLAERIGDKRQLEIALFSLGDVLRDLRQLREAIQVLGKAADIAGLRVASIRRMCCCNSACRIPTSARFPRRWKSPTGWRAWPARTGECRFSHMQAMPVARLTSPRGAGLMPASGPIVSTLRTQ